MEVEDECISEFDVKLNSTSDTRFLFLQYPLRPRYRPYGDQGSLSSARFKSEEKSLELVYSLDTQSVNYDRNSSSFQVTSQTLSGKPVSAKASYYIGLIKDDCLSLTPVDSTIQLRPSMRYVDADISSRIKIKDAEEEVAAKAKKAQKLKVSKKRKEEKEAKVSEEWVSLRCIPFRDEETSTVFHKLGVESSDILMPDITPTDYIEQLLPETEHSVGKLERMRTLPLSLRIEEVLKIYKEIEFEKLLELVGDDRTDIVLNILQQKAQLQEGVYLYKETL